MTLKPDPIKKKKIAPGWVRTTDLQVNSLALYRLSYKSLLRGDQVSAKKNIVCPTLQECCGVLLLQMRIAAIVSTIIFHQLFQSTDGKKEGFKTSEVKSRLIETHESKAFCDSLNISLINCRCWLNLIVSWCFKIVY